jgi:hypothetical protein
MGQQELERLEALIGEWSIEVSLPGAPPGDIGARVSFEWMPGKQFVVQRWEVPVTDAPDGLAIIGLDGGGPGYLQHYFDSRGVARVYKMSFGDGVWELWRDAADFSPLDFSQRYTGTFTDDGQAIEGGWEIAHDGSTWEHDFDLGYKKLG